MHEMSIAMAVVEQVEQAAARLAADGAVPPAVREVRLEVGELAGVLPDSLSFCFDLACSGTVLEGSSLTAGTVPGRARCAPCDHEWPTGMPPQLGCPRCGAGASELLSGRELRITEVRWAEPVPPGPPVPLSAPLAEER
ncbi:hydrogenase maturation nickel metallochaperone HypA [Streptomyces sp. NPDC088354]|uniref:hydrogenase maturation nickel metallochaperone HypA/HybF n=1 Tax=unclassified Streptomyces TaxID=2593676 RepID=UPI0029B98398|nr:hydrogenase maturation nickel metallochaperone HypA [Streptomyces sp. MI02-7b]MDX3073794.1 hydrogenase maturation nickel metallochaperone HypA [Streptomyces sp. MI02-7b]